MDPHGSSSANYQYSCGQSLAIWMGFKGGYRHGSRAEGSQFKVLKSMFPPHGTPWRSGKLLQLANKFVPP